jgi:hypothetical protein
MQLLVKTLKGGKFPVEAEPTNTVAEVKAIIVSKNSVKSRQRWNLWAKVDYFCSGGISPAWGCVYFWMLSYA